ncbi:hypothetical protein VTJ04DRAFT_9417 [Mycothermus thermophilus]|uniref:uncharacterized protein n=1 Tax=Humicola insolens TaxID=85995 RepID=UPI003742625C
MNHISPILWCHRVCEDLHYSFPPVYAIPQLTATFSAPQSEEWVEMHVAQPVPPSFGPSLSHSILTVPLRDTSRPLIVLSFHVRFSCHTSPVAQCQSGELCSRIRGNGVKVKRVPHSLLRRQESQVSPAK